MIKRFNAHRGRIVFQDVAVTYTLRGVSHNAVAATNQTVAPGEFVCLLGPSGCGKSTLLNCVAGFIAPTTGRVEVDGEAITAPGPDRGMVFQQHSLFPWKTVRENIAYGPRIGGHGEHKALAIADKFLSMIGLTKFADSYPAALSGGMQQRVGIARALANYPNVLLMDEPFGALDAQTRLLMQENLLAIWQEFRITVLFVTHDIDEAIFLGDRILVMSASPGNIIEELKVSLPRPRKLDDMAGPEFLALRHRCLTLLTRESRKVFEAKDD
ncbi:ABC transporter ATP-binding protein [Martelella alba]|uniref:ABC transporter ATP-binding protein n=1 Tax=Martelella alba TaxID=2590451 RepID=A0ABY2SQT7_9HYPH|nr:ABC transporter ATP-binding protein [Martelella alba]TKI07186.1 ABC transporter ATP-binding protein [Martelella alba]